MPDDLFKYEREVLDEAMEIVENEEYEAEELFAKYKSIVLDYQKFLRQMRKILSISDNQQKLLKRTQKKLEAEIVERKKAEEKLKAVNQKLKDMSFLDGLTEIPNRRRFDEVLKKEKNRVLRQEGYLAVLMLDIDFFKEFNDTYGHLAGDDCLKKIAALLSNNLNRASDFVARYGGEEFVVILPHTKEDEAAKIAEKLRIKIEEEKIEHKSSNISDYVTVSIGAAAITVDNRQSAAEFVDAADKVLYRAKNKGRNQVQTIKIN
ncbi:MAG: GGDEF domain-containing protein [Halanaerobacter sp.]